MKYVAVEGMELDYGLDEVASCTLGPAGSKSSIDGNGIYAGPLSITLSGVSNETMSQGTGTGVFVPTSQHVTAGGLPVLLEGDVAMVTVAGIITEGGAPASWVVTARVSSAGQDSVTAD